MNAKQLVSIITYILLIAGLAVCIAWICVNQDAVKKGLQGANLYTEEDLQNSYKDGYDSALSDKDSYVELIDSLRDEKITLTDQLSQANASLTQANNSIKDKQSQIDTLTEQKTELETNVSNLQTINSQNEITITGLNETISELQSQVKILEASESDKTSQISALNTQISNLQTLVSQLQNTNEINSNTITSLNAQIISLNSQISDLTYQLQNNGSIVTSLNNKIAQLEESIAYYENYIASLESGEQVVVTFEFDGSVYNIQLLNKNATASVTTPTSTDYVIFNYWTVNGEQIELSTYQFTTNTKVVANVTYKYDVKFMVDNAEHNSQIVTSGTIATVPTTPTKSGYEFDGWSLNGVDIVDVTQQTVTANVTYYAVFTQLHTVTFIYEDDTIDTQTVRNGEYATAPQVNSTTYKVFNGWTINSIITAVSTYKITSATTFVADITYKYDVTFMVDNEEYDTQIVTSGNYATEPTQPTKTGYTFKGWSINGSDIVSVTSTLITANTTFIAVFDINSYTVQFNDGTQIIDTQQVNYSSYASVPNEPTKEDYIFKGWSLDGSSVVTVSSTLITEHTTFIAVWSATMNGVFSNGNYTLTIKNNAIVSFPNILLDESDKVHDGYYQAYREPVGFFTLEYKSDNDVWVFTTPAESSFNLIRIED